MTDCQGLPVTICSSAGLLSFFLKQKSPNALDKARLPVKQWQTKIIFCLIANFLLLYCTVRSEKKLTS